MTLDETRLTPDELLKELKTYGVPSKEGLEFLNEIYGLAAEVWVEEFKKTHDGFDPVSLVQHLLKTRGPEEGKKAAMEALKAEFKKLMETK